MLPLLSYFKHHLRRKNHGLSIFCIGLMFLILLSSRRSYREYKGECITLESETHYTSVFDLELGVTLFVLKTTLKFIVHIILLFI